MSAFSVSVLEARLSCLRQDLATAGLDALVVTHPPNLRYLSGFSGSAGALLVTPRRRLLMVDGRYVTAARALGRPSETEPLEIGDAPTGVDDAVVAAVRCGGFRRVGVEAASLTIARFNRWAAGLAAGDPMPAPGTAGCPVLVLTEGLVERYRSRKDEAEIATLREAAARLSGVARGLPGLIAAGRQEWEVGVDVDLALKRAGFERPAFETIVASGPNSALPHARPGTRRLANGDSVVLDFGGVYDGYCVDLTRTLAVGAAPAGLRRLFEAVMEARSAAIAAVRPGVRASEVDTAARGALARHGLAEAFGHGTGHGLGLEVHEEPRLGPLLPGRPDPTLAAGMVITIEPGVYVPGLGGVRIEDDVLLVEGGCEILTDVPIEL